MVSAMGSEFGPGDRVRVKKRVLSYLAGRAGEIKKVVGHPRGDQTCYSVLMDDDLVQTSMAFWGDELEAES
jgi:hypothetical protein